jgi:hypothetical protein
MKINMLNKKAGDGRTGLKRAGVFIGVCGLMKEAQ